MRAVFREVVGRVALLTIGLSAAVVAATAWLLRALRNQTWDGQAWPAWVLVVALVIDALVLAAMLLGWRLIALLARRYRAPRSAE